MRKQILLLGAVVFFCIGSKAQDAPFEKFYIVPSVSVGLTFGATFNVGIDCDMMTSTTTRPDRIKRGGLNVGHYWVKTKGKTNPHRITSLNFAYENEFMDLKTGVGLIKYKWGYSNVNRWGLPGWTADISFTQRDNNLPWVGIKTFVYPQREWVWFNHPYASPYLKYKQYITLDAE